MWWQDTQIDNKLLEKRILVPNSQVENFGLTLCYQMMWYDISCVFAMIKVVCEIKLSEMLGKNLVITNVFKWKAV